MALTKNEKREIVTAQLKQLRKDLRGIHAGVTEEQTLPEPDQIKTVMTQMEDLLEILEPKKTRKPKKSKN